jgi:hypothetical protein
MSTQTPGNPPEGVVFDEAAFKRKMGAAIKLLVLFCTVYFSAAVIATAKFADIAGILIFGIPLAIYTGLLVFAVGFIVTRMCLAQDKGA